MKYLIMVSLLIGAVVTLALTNNINELDIEQAQYCDMVSIYHESGGENGWPDFKQTYSTSCLN